MKTRLFTRLSALMAGLTVALVGSLSALPQAHAATTYQLNQVGGSVEIQRVTFQEDGRLVPGQFSNNLIVNGEKRRVGVYYSFSTTFSFSDLSKVNAGDKIVIPISSDSAMFKPKVASFSGSVPKGSSSPVFNVNVNSNETQIVFTATNNVTSYANMNGELDFTIVTYNLGVQGTQEQWKVNVGNDYYTIFHLPFNQVGYGISSSLISYVPDSYQAKPVPSLDFRLPGLANAAIDGTIPTKFPEAVSGDIWQYAIITPLTRPVVPTLYEGATTTQILAYDEVHFSQYFAHQLTSNISFTKKTVRAVDLAKPEDTLKVLSPGEYALFDNGDGTWTYAVNWGTWQNNERTAIPNPIPSNITDATLKAKLNEYRGKGHGVQGVRSRIQLEFQGAASDYQVANVELVNGIGTQKLNAYSKDVMTKSGDVSGSGDLLDATVFYSANGATSGTAPANQTSTVGTKVTIAPKGTLARTGYSFTGWNTAANGSGTAYAENQQVTLPKNGLRLYAQWKINNYNVTFDKNAADATGTTAALTGKAYGSKVTLTANGFKRTGYTFKNWNTKADGKGTAYADKASFTIPAGNTTLYAQWKEVADVVPGDQPQPDGYVKVSFDKGDHGTLSGDTSFWVNPNKSVTLKAPTVKANTGYKFSKWDKALTQQFKAATTITAQYTKVTSPTASPTTPGPKPTASPTTPVKPTPTGTPSVKPKPTVSPTKPAPSPSSSVGDKVKDESGNPVKPTDTSGKDVSKKPVADGVKVSVDDKLKCKSATDKACVAVDSKGNAVVHKDGNGNAPTGVTVATTDANGDGVADKVKVTGVKYPESDLCAVDDPSKQEKVYRLYNPGNSEHLFTTDKVEYDILPGYGWKQEGVSWVGPNRSGSSVGVYRLYNAGLGDHHYTKDPVEATKLVREHGWVYDNNGQPLFYSEENTSCTRIPVYRQYNGGLKSGQHHYTADKVEWDTLAAFHGWKKEGIGWYALSWIDPKKQ